MPFTLSHVAAILPLRKKRLITSALVFGAMAPDFEYFLYFSPHGKFGHTLIGLVVLTTPLALAALWLFHRYVKYALAAVLPDSVQQRLGGGLKDFSFGGWERFRLIVASILVGALTHVVWDSFTHLNGFAVEHIALLRHPVWIRWWIPYSVPLCRVLQHLSTLFGLAVLTLWATGWYRSTEPSGLPARPWSGGVKIGVVCGLGLIAAAGGLMSAVFVSPTLISKLTRDRVIAAFVVTFIGLLWWELVGLGVWRRWSSEPS